MFINYLKIAWRNLWKSKFFSFLNVFGLALGLACFILIGMYVTDELSYDKFYDKADRIFRINSDIRIGGTELILSQSADPMGATLKNDYPQVEEYVRFYSSTGPKLVKKGTDFIEETDVTHADSTLLKVFNLKVLVGENDMVLTEPNTVIITKSAAERYFGNPQNALGKTLETDDNGSTLYKVTSVIEDIPRNSHFHFDFFFSMENVEYPFGTFLSHNFQTYVVLQQGVDYRKFNEKFEEVIAKYIIPQAQAFIEVKSIDEFRASGNKLEYSLIPMTDIHLHSSRSFELEANGNIQYVYIFSAAALFILLIACVNFMNLSTARSEGRAKEVGVRKVLGTGKTSLIWQFLTESILLAYIGMILALLLVLLTLGWFNQISGKEIPFNYLWRPTNLLILFLLPFVVGSFAGVYPAFFLSSFKPITVLKGKLMSNGKENTLRSALVVFQFATSIILIIGTIVIYNQLSFIRNSNVGFNKDQMVVVDLQGMQNNSQTAFKNEIEKLSAVKSATFAGFLPVGNSSRSDTTVSSDPVMTQDNSVNTQIWRVDYDYIPTLGMEIIKGRNFDPSFGSDSTSVIINETAAKLFGYDDPIGQNVYATYRGEETPAPYKIIGVVKNFNYESLRKNVFPLIMRLGSNQWKVAFKVAGNDMQPVLDKIESTFHEMAPGMPYKYQFLDESFENMYREEQRVGQVALSFSILAILIACLGLFGLATFIAEKRTKEIGIRKVLGASVSNIVTMLSKDFLKLVIIAFIIAIPIAWFAMYKWLEDFAFKISIKPWVFIVTGLVAIIIAITTISFRAIRAALANPSKSLRTE
ncbi:ABC transporter permease [Aegicerativicinus sediminis]|uniref:ABC transporter permease n=1 Tax=Aegicerativicinus sediminis TaxID=2893202 RepID=UPI001E5DFCE9|nr:ABC transporter permease [Aegicerativicinus sediminis]